MAVEHPLFVPYRDEHVAAVLTLPDGSPRGFVMLLQGLGALRSHKNRLWTRTARELAERGIASARMDYGAIGDSTGRFEDRGDAPVGEVRAVIGAALRATGLKEFAIVGNCLGVRTGFAIAARSASCVSMVCLVPGSLDALMRRVDRSALGRAARGRARRSPRMRRIAHRVLRRNRFGGGGFLPDIPVALDSTDVLFLFLGREEVGLQLADALGNLASRRPHGPERRVVVRSVPAVKAVGIPVRQSILPAVIEEVTDWMDRTLPGIGGPDLPSAAIEPGVKA